MQPENLSERALKIAREAEAFQDAIERFGPGFEKRWRDQLRRLAAEEVEQAFQKVMREAAVWDATIKNIPSLYAGKEALVEASHNSEYRLKVCAEERPEKDAIYLPVKYFKNVIIRLKTLILDEKMDEHIHLTGEQLIYDRIRLREISQIGYVPVPHSKEEIQKSREPENRRAD